MDEVADIYCKWPLAGDLTNVSLVGRCINSCSASTSMSDMREGGEALPNASIQSVINHPNCFER